MFDQMYTLLFAPSNSGGIPWWVWVILIIILLVLLWFWFGREGEELEQEIEEKIGEEPLLDMEEGLPNEPDDLKKIEGIGPKVAGILNQAGINTFQEMVDAGAEKLEALLDETGLQMINADTWPEQAKLAASGDWEALAKLQDELKGGKRVK